MYMCIYIYKYILALSVKWPRNNATQVVKSTPSPHILFSKYHFPIKGFKVLKRNGLCQS